MVPIKLTTTNYLTWRALFALIFRWYNLTEFIDGTIAAPSKFFLDASGNRTATLNPQYVAWYENDQNILIWINSTLSDALIPYIVEIADALANVSAPIEDSELISVILHGLPSKYESFIDVVQFRLCSTTVDKLHGILLSKELQLNARKPASLSTSIQAFNTSDGLLPTPTSDFGSQAFFTQNGSTSNRGNFFNSRHFHNRGTQRNFQGSQSHPRFNRGNQGNHQYNHGNQVNHQYNHGNQGSRSYYNNST
nr:uncharacterized protein LOC114820895 [Malus domestica]